MMKNLFNRVRNKLEHEKRAFLNGRRLLNCPELTRSPQRRTAVLNFSARRMERHYYFIAKFLSIGGYTVFIANNRGWLGSINMFKKDFFKIANLFAYHKGQTPVTDLYLYDDPSLATAVQAHKRIYVRIDVFNFNPGDENHLTMPLPMSVEQYTILDEIDLEEIRKSERSVKILYSGNLDKDKYDSKEIKTIYKKLSRLSIIEYLKEKLSDNEFEIRNSATDTHYEYTNKFVLYNWYWNELNNNLAARIQNKDWLRYLSKADFFLCCPGIVMPPTHAVVEAMSVGTIPIMEFPEYYPEGLEHNFNCIIYNGKEDLLEKIRLVINMPRENILTMRQEVISYYEQNLSPEAYISKLQNISPPEFHYFLYTSYSHL